MSGADGSGANTATHTADTPQLLLEHHLKELRLPATLREYDKVTIESGADEKFPQVQPSRSPAAAGSMAPERRIRRH